MKVEIEKLKDGSFKLRDLTSGNSVVSGGMDGIIKVFCSMVNYPVSYLVEDLRNEQQPSPHLEGVEEKTGADYINEYCFELDGAVSTTRAIEAVNAAIRDTKKQLPKEHLEGVEEKKWTNFDIIKAIDIARSKDFECMADGKSKICYCRNADRDCTYRHYKSADEIIKLLANSGEKQQPKADAGMEDGNVRIVRGEDGWG